MKINPLDPFLTGAVFGGAVMTEYWLVAGVAFLGYLWFDRRYRFR